MSFEETLSQMVSMQYLSQDFRSPKASSNFIFAIRALLLLGYHIVLKDLNFLKLTKTHVKIL